jgi:membrane protease YdiL (CAAX protease family)
MGEGQSSEHRGRTWAALAFTMLFPGLMAWVYFVVLVPSPDARPGYLALGSYALAKLIQFVFPVLWIWFHERDRLRFQPHNFRGLVFGLAFGALVFVLVLALYHGALRTKLVMAGTPARVTAKVAQFHAATPARYILLAVFLAGIHSLLEEYYWRWFVFGELRNRMPTTGAIALSSTAFMLHHVIILAVFFPGSFWTMTLPFSLGVGCGGAVWAWLYQRTGSIYSPWLSHLIIDAAILTVGYDMLFVSVP